MSFFAKNQPEKSTKIAFLVVLLSMLLFFFAYSFSPAYATFSSTLNSSNFAVTATSLATPTGLAGTAAESCSGGDQPGFSLSWTPDANKDYTGNYLVRGYNLERATTSGGTYASVQSTSGNPPAVTVNDYPSGEIPSLYVANNGSNTITAQNLSTFATSSITSTGVGSEANTEAFSADGSHLYVANAGSTNVTDITTATNATASINLGSGAVPNALLTLASTGEIWVDDSNNANVDTINPATDAITHTIAIGNVLDPTAMTVLPNDSQVYVAEYTSKKIAAISTATHAVTSTISLPSAGRPIAMVASPDSSHLYVADVKNSAIQDVTTSSDTITASITVSSLSNSNAPNGTPNIMAITPDGKTLYVASASGKKISVINTATDTVTSTIADAGNDSPVALQIDNSGCSLYALESNNTLVKIPTTGASANTITATLTLGFTLGSFPTLATSPDDTSVVVSCATSNRVLIVTASSFVIAHTTTTTAPAAILVEPANYYYKLQATRDSWLSSFSTILHQSLGVRQVD